MSACAHWGMKASITGSQPLSDSGRWISFRCKSIYMEKTLVAELNADYELIFTDVPSCLATAHKIIKANESMTMVPVEDKDTTDNGRKR